jgi:proteasome lid subunit RPN8/RPN11
MSTKQIESSTKMYLECYEVEDGPYIYAEPLDDPAFERARLSALWEAFLADRLETFAPGQNGCRIEPVFEELNGGSPRAVGFVVEVSTSDDDIHRVAFEVNHIRGRARSIASELLRQGRISTGSTLLYGLSACPRGDDDARRERPLFTLDRPTADIAILPGSRAALAPEEPWDSPRADDLPVLVHRQVIVDAAAEAGAAPDHEIGGFLLGHLRRDAVSRQPFLEVTNLVPAQNTAATASSLTFTPDSWSHVRRLIDLRGDGEILVGWMHSHPFRFCAECPIPAPEECIAKILFFSRDDEFLMETAFPLPYMVGLLAAVEPRLPAALGHPSVRLFGWEKGAIRARGFHVVGP